MKRLIFVFVVIIFFPLSNFAQGFVPSYPEVVKNFFRLYKNESYTKIEFAKKKEGWFVIKEDSLNAEQLFWDQSISNYNELQNFEQVENEAIAKSAGIDYLNSNTLNKYMFERCKYYGYDGWAEDMINEFEGKSNLNDTIMEGLARAYTNYADGFLLNYSGYSKHTKLLANSDYLSTELPEHKVLDYYELPSDRRIQLAIKYMNEGISIWEKLSKSNPKYQTLVGNTRMKSFNDKMYGYYYMLICKKNVEARNFLNKIEFDESIERIGKKYLDACPQNSILITFGDNDTYPLWYLQQVKNYRNDVIVINNGLLASPHYVDYLKKSKLVQFRIPENFYSKSEFSYLYFKEEENINSNRPISLFEFLSFCYNDKFKKNTDSDNKIKNYPYSQTNLIIDPSKFLSISKQKNLTNFLSFQNGDYLALNELLLFDIIEQNINSRPILFTSIDEKFKNYLQFDGILYQLLPINENDSISNETSIFNMEKNLNNKIQMLSYNLKDNLSFYADTYIINYYNLIISFYLEKGDKASALKRAKEALSIIDKIQIDLNSNLILFSELLLKLDQKDSAVKVLHLLINSMVDNWIYPSALRYEIRSEWTEYYLEEIKRLTKTYSMPNLFQK